MDLYLVRHAIAEQRDARRWPDDAQRPLTREGAERFHGVARGLRALGVRVDAVLSSSYARARSTAHILEAEARWPAPVGWTELHPQVDPRACVDSIFERPEHTLALVGHQPQLSRVASLLVAGEPEAFRLELRKGGVVFLRATDGLAPGTGVLRWSASPKMLRRLGRKPLRTSS
jgi:phosphohistidine phosphatase